MPAADAMPREEMTNFAPTGPVKTLPPKGFESLVREHHRRLLAYAQALARRGDVAEDLVQEALLVTHRDLSRFDASRDFGAWVRGIIRLKYLEWTRTHRMSQLSEAQLDAVEAEHRRWDQAAEEGRGEALSALRACREGLGEHVVRTIDLFYSEHRSCAQIAALTGSSEVVVRKRLQRAREALGECLKKRLGVAFGA